MLKITWELEFKHMYSGKTFWYLWQFVLEPMCMIFLVWKGLPQGRINYGALEARGSIAIN